MYRQSQNDACIFLPKKYPSPAPAIIALPLGTQTTGFFFWRNFVTFSHLPKKKFTIGVISLANTTFLHFIVNVYLPSKLITGFGLGFFD
jgi:hypothetical protein